MSLDSQTTADSIERDRVQRARRMSVEQRLIQGTELFEYACEASLAGLRAQFPDASADELHRRLRQRLTRARTIEANRL